MVAIEWRDSNFTKLYEIKFLGLKQKKTAFRRQRSFRVGNTKVLKVLAKQGNQFNSSCMLKELPYIFNLHKILSKCKHKMQKHEKKLIVTLFYILFSVVQRCVKALFYKVSAENSLFMALNQQRSWIFLRPFDILRGNRFVRPYYYEGSNRKHSRKLAPIGWLGLI